MNVGWHGPTGTRGIAAGMWDILRDVPPAVFTFLHGERVRENDIQSILAINPRCQFVMRIYRKFMEPVDHRSYIDYAKSAIEPGSWEAIPLGQRNLQIWNEPNMRHTSPDPAIDQWEGFGPTAQNMRDFNKWYVTAWHELKAVNPTWRICFPPLTPGNRDAFFHTDTETVDYYMHGPEAAVESDHGEPDMGAAIASCLCKQALELAEVYLAHIYVLNDVDFQMREIWAGMRWLQYWYFLAEHKRGIPIFINELGINGSRELADYHELLRTQYPQVFGTCIWKLGEPYVSPNQEDVRVLRDYVRALPPTPPRQLPPSVVPSPGPAPQPQPPGDGDLVQMRPRVGIHWRNSPDSRERDFQAVRVVKMEAIKVMSFTPPEVAIRLRQESELGDRLEFLVRLYSGAFGAGHRHPSPDDFVKEMRPRIDAWLPFARKYEVHNEPNHHDGIEGWGSTDADARDFNDWFMVTFDLLHRLYPEALFGFPGLALNQPHRDLEWLQICRPAIEQAHWLGAHAYWQNPTAGDKNHLSLDWGMRPAQYSLEFPGKLIEITEVGCSNGVDGLPMGRIPDDYVEWLAEMFRFAAESGVVNVGAAYFFLLSAPQEAWLPFVWVLENGSYRPVVNAVGSMARPPLFEQAEPRPPKPPEVPIEEVVREAVINAAHNAIGRKYEGGVPYNPDAAFMKLGHGSGLGMALTPEQPLYIGKTLFRYQVFALGVVYAQVPHWDDLKVIGLGW